MLNFFIILLTNVFTGIIIYLVLTIRLEKKTSTYEQEKIRREFEEIIRDFNASADRNIGLLENRINILKKLLHISGSLDTINVEALDKHTPREHKKPTGYTIIKDMPENTQQERGSQTGNYSFLVDEKIELDNSTAVLEEEEPRIQEIISRRYTDGGRKQDTLVTLYGEGHSVELISESTGISAAEIEIILKLNGINTGEDYTAHGL